MAKEKYESQEEINKNKMIKRIIKEVRIEDAMKAEIESEEWIKVYKECDTTYTKLIVKEILYKKMEEFIYKESYDQNKKYQNNDVAEYIEIFTDKFFDALDKYKSEKKVRFITYLKAVLVNEGRKVSNKFKKEKELIYESYFSFGQFENHIISPEKYANENIRKELIEKCINRLGEEDKFIVGKLYGLCGFEETKQTEIAKEIKRTQSYVSKRLEKIYKKLKPHIMEELYA